MTDSRLQLMVQAISNKKGFHISALDLRKLLGFVDYLVVAEGSSERHLQTLCEEIIQEMERSGARLWHQEGAKGGLWAVLDFGDIMVHLFGPELRELYRLESLWSQAELIDLKSGEQP